MIGSGLKEIQGWEWRDLNQPVVETEMVVAGIRLKKIQIPQQNSLLVQFSSAVRLTLTIQITGKNSNEKSTEKHDVRVGDSIQGVTPDFPIQMGQSATGMLESREMGIFQPTSTLHGLKEIKGIGDALSLVGWQAQSEKEQMEVSSPIKYNVGFNEEKGSILEPTGKEIARKTKVEAN
nr:hypothetical protein CFP56_39616 [Quercus suber]